MEQNTNYDFSCPYCKSEYSAKGLPNLEIMKKIGHTIKCPKCGRKISIINDTNMNMEENRVIHRDIETIANRMVEIIKNEYMKDSTNRGQWLQRVFRKVSIESATGRLPQLIFEYYFLSYALAIRTIYQQCKSVHIDLLNNYEGPFTYITLDWLTFEPSDAEGTTFSFDD